MLTVGDILASTTPRDKRLRPLDILHQTFVQIDTALKIGQEIVKQRRHRRAGAGPARMAGPLHSDSPNLRERKS